MTTEGDIRFITRYYESLCGLINLPIALFLMMMASQEFFPGPLWEQGDLTITLPLMVLMFLAMILITRYYRRRYGSVQVQHPGRYFLFVMIAIVTIMLAGWIDDGLLERNFRFPVSLYVLTVAIWMFLGGQNRRRWYYRVFGGILALLSLYPGLANLLGFEPYSSFYNGLFNLILGLGIGIVGILDHLMLTRMLRPVQEAPNAQS